RLSESPEISRLEAPPQVSAGPPLESPRLQRGAGVANNLAATGAPQVWAQGYTGKGRLICSFDTGVEGSHPALKRSWNGRDGDSAASWFDPVGGVSAPHIFTNITNSSHGTHVMGIMCGADTLTGDTIGMAPGARWISAAVIDIPGASIVDAFQWAADPDGDPNTFADVPDVINHSWGVPNRVMGCDELFWSLIDNTEALGIVNIFAAGNEGRSGAASIRNPANRALNEVDCFAVGNIDHRDPGETPLEPSSSRGPSDCDGVSVKPNLCAPGVNIWSAEPGSRYSFRTGTSMSAPHVSGAVALLRQKNPNATPAAIKAALLAGARNLGPAGPDTDYGWGALNVPAALAALAAPAPVELRVYALTPNMPDAGGELTGQVTLQNVGDPNGVATGVSVEIGRAPAQVSVLTPELTFSRRPGTPFYFSDLPLRLQVTDTLSPGSVITLPVTIRALNGETFADEIFVLIGERVHQQFFTHRTDRLEFTISN
ncbi:MAG TPA: S8 family serine peptidase, partial [candidate division Zixibacteria bacterium]|nr:S8 family serine peptidase [candidate division Zixibacteria bacterium]